MSIPSTEASSHNESSDQHATPNAVAVAVAVRSMSPGQGALAFRQETLCHVELSATTQLCGDTPTSQRANSPGCLDGPPRTFHTAEMQVLRRRDFKTRGSPPTSHPP